MKSFAYRHITYYVPTYNVWRRVITTILLLLLYTGRWKNEQVSD